MKIQSFIRHGLGLRAVDVEISLLPGLPQVRFLGLADTAIKESELRIKSALRHQGFELPAARQILINLKPSYIKKTSRGLDLAVAAGILWATEQVEKPISQNVALYGELSLNGDVVVPDDFDQIFDLGSDTVLYSGQSVSGVGFDYLAVRDLKQLSVPTSCRAESVLDCGIRPPLEDLKFSAKQAELLKIIALGEHPTLLAGPHGTGKTTMADACSKLLVDPTADEFRRSRQIAKLFGKEISWRPIINPHHSTTSLAMIGGGVPPFPGEITRADGGTLILDEFLEFDSRVQEALREPLETSKITISRCGEVQQFPAQFLLLATTNLCQCGAYLPGKDNRCQCSGQKLRTYLSRISGPMLDRFHILFFSRNDRGVEKLSIQEILEAVQQARAFAQKNRPQETANSRERLKVIEDTVEAFTKKHLFPEVGSSLRRYGATLRVARSVADLEGSIKIKGPHLQKAYELTVQPFRELRSHSHG